MVAKGSPGGQSSSHTGRGVRTFLEVCPGPDTSSGPNPEPQCAHPQKLGMLRICFRELLPKTNENNVYNVSSKRQISNAKCWS